MHVKTNPGDVKYIPAQIREQVAWGHGRSRNVPAASPADRSLFLHESTGQNGEAMLSGGFSSGSPPEIRDFSLTLAQFSTEASKPATG